MTYVEPLQAANLKNIVRYEVIYWSVKWIASVWYLQTAITTDNHLIPIGASYFTSSSILRNSRTLAEKGTNGIFHIYMSYLSVL